MEVASTLSPLSLPHKDMALLPSGFPDAYLFEVAR
jgi:hypothetical protein